MRKNYRITVLNVYDFETSDCSYALQTNKNIFGYSCQNEYFLKNKKVYSGKKVDNVEDNLFYWLAFQINVDQQKSLKRKIQKIRKHETLENMEETETTIEQTYSLGSKISYSGKNKQKFISKILCK